MNLDWFKSLIVSRKFWLMFLGVATAAIMFAGGDISADQLIDAIIKFVGFLIGGIALEDAAKKFNAN